MDALGMIEVNSIAVGIETADIMMKTAEVKLMDAQPICCGKYMVLVRGGVAEVESSVGTGRGLAGDSMVDSFVIANIHPHVFSAISCTTEVKEKGAVGIVETFTLAACIVSADTAVKAAEVELVEIRLGRGLGGKSFVVMTGDVSAVKHAVETCVKQSGLEGMVAGTAIIPSPHPELKKALY